jgi:hypothetical protein
MRERKRGNWRGAEGREGIVEEYRAEREKVKSRGQRGNRREAEGIGGEQRG